MKVTFPKADNKENFSYSTKGVPHIVKMFLFKDIVELFRHFPKYFFVKSTMRPSSKEIAIIVNFHGNFPWLL